MADININYEHVLGDLQRRRGELDSAIAAIERILGQRSGGSGVQEGAQPPIGAGGPIRSDTFLGMSIPKAIQKYLEIMKRPCTVAEIAKGIEDGGFTSQAKNFYANVSTAMRRLDKRGIVVQMPGTKQWGMAAWYPGQPKRDAENPAEGNE